MHLAFGIHRLQRAPITRNRRSEEPVTHYQSFGVTLDYAAVSGDGKKILFTRIDKTGDIYTLEHTPD
jgi:hypothetical protein